MSYLTEKPDDMTDADWADYSQCQAEAADIESQILDREYAYERGDIDWAGYQAWQFDYGPLEPASPGEGWPPVVILDEPPF